jgi:hypothetical protein
MNTSKMIYLNGQKRKKAEKRVGSILKEANALNKKQDAYLHLSLDGLDTSKRVGSPRRDPGQQSFDARLC